MFIFLKYFDKCTFFILALTTQFFNFRVAKSNKIKLVFLNYKNKAINSCTCVQCHCYTVSQGHKSMKIIPYLSRYLPVENNYLVL